MRTLEEKLLNDFQRDFPLVARPYAAIAQRAGASEDAVIAALSALSADGRISRIGATFYAGCIGAATLAALAVPPARLAEVAARVSARAEVNHNYEREHRYNLWFVVTGPDARHVANTVSAIEREAGCGTVLSLPMVEPYHIDLGFDLRRSAVQRAARTERLRKIPSLQLNAAERSLVAALQEGVPLEPRPWARLGERAGLDEAAVLATLRGWLEARAINRLGVIVRHHELGFRANAMVVFDVPDNEVGAAGARAATMPFVNLCYRRLRDPALWRYNLYCMIHGVSREGVVAQIAQLRAGCGLLAYPHAILFSRQRFKQRGACYLPAAGAVAHG